MDCRKARRSLSLMADDNLAPEEIGSLDEHLGACPECARFARTVEAVTSHFASLPRPAAPEGMTAAVLARIREPGARLLTLQPLLRLTAVAAVVLFLLTGTAALFLKPGGDQSTGETDSRLTADGALDWIMADIARESAPRVAQEDER